MNWAGLAMGYEQKKTGEEDCGARCSTKCGKSRLNYSKSGCHLRVLSCQVLLSETVAVRGGGGGEWGHSQRRGETG